MNYADYFYYDESSPSCLRWKINIGTRIKAGSCCGSLASDNHWRVGVNRKYYYCHRIIWELLVGEIDKGKCIDHISGDSRDNRITNLRVVDKPINNRNAKMRKDNTLGVKGISILTNIDRNGVPYSYVSAYIQCNGSRVNKRFPLSKYTKEEAIELAVKWRLSQIEQLNKAGAGYTDRHIYGDEVLDGKS